MYVVIYVYTCKYKPHGCTFKNKEGYMSLVDPTATVNQPLLRVNLMLNFMSQLGSTLMPRYGSDIMDVSGKLFLDKVNI